MRSLVGGVLLFAVAQIVLAQELRPHMLYSERTRSAEQVTALKSDLFGDKVNLYNGATEFEATDIDLPGNNALPVRLQRRLKVEGQAEGFDHFGGFGQWDLDLPHIYTTVPDQWGAGGQRCSQQWLPTPPPPFGLFEVHNGVHLRMPDGSGAELLRLHAGDGRPRPSDGGVYHWGSRNEHRVACMSSATAQGEGFVVLDPSGNRYVFDVLTSRAGGILHKGEYTQPKIGFYMLPSRVTDRHGNRVDYSYEAGRLVRIQSSDGRRIDLAWSNGAIVQATAHGRTWTYQYGSPYFSVLQPDGTSWQYSGSARTDTRWAYQALDLETTAGCPEAPLAGPLVLDLEMRHPSGAVGTFHFTYTRHGRTGTPASACVVYMSTPVDPVQSIPHYELAVPDYMDNFALTAKVVGGPGVAPMQWNYAYGGGSGGGRLVLQPHSLISSRC